jgi:hypothetical protein
VYTSTTTIWEALIFRTLLGVFAMKLKSKKWYHSLGYDVNTWLPVERVQLGKDDNYTSATIQYSISLGVMQQGINTGH